MAASFGFQLNVSADIKSFICRIDDTQNRDLPFVTAYALTKTAQDVKTAEIEVMARVFDRPTRFTLNALYVKPATKSDLRAYVLFKDGFGSVPAWRYLGPEVEGGPRKHKSFEKRLISAGLMLDDEFAVPGKGVKLDSYGNVAGSLIQRILSELGAQADSQQNSTARSRKRRKAIGKYLVLRDLRGAPPGIYYRKDARQIVPIFMFVRPPHYTQRFPYYATAERIMGQNFARHFRDGWRLYVEAGIAKAA